jgi:hypothetical protein
MRRTELADVLEAVASLRRTHMSEIIDFGSGGSIWDISTVHGEIDALVSGLRSVPPGIEHDDDRLAWCGRAIPRLDVIARISEVREKDAAETWKAFYNLRKSRRQSAGTWAADFVFRALAVGIGILIVVGAIALAKLIL